MNLEIFIFEGKYHRKDQRGGWDVSFEVKKYLFVFIYVFVVQTGPPLFVSSSWLPFV